jgi:hypothetical protein
MTTRERLLILLNPAILSKAFRQDCRIEQDYWLIGRLKV